MLEAGGEDGVASYPLSGPRLLGHPGLPHLLPTGVQFLCWQDTAEHNQYADLVPPLTSEWLLLRSSYRGAAEGLEEPLLEMEWLVMLLVEGALDLSL